jgi:hypothetical protein
MSLELAAAPPVEGYLDAALSRLGSTIDGIALLGMSLAYSGPLELPARAEIAAAAVPDGSLDRFFSFLEDATPRAELVEEIADARLPGGVVYDLRFRTAYEPFYDAQRERRAGWTENHTIRVRHWRHDDGASHPAVILLHGFGMGAVPWMDARVLCAPQWFARGLDVALLTLPLHGSRCPRDVPYSGGAFASWDATQLNESIRESVHDIDCLLQYLQAGSGGAVGIIGLSLGGYLASLMAELSTRPAFVVPLAAPVFLGDLPSRLFAMRRGSTCAPPLTSVEMEEAYRVHSPLARPLAIPRERALIVAGRGDCFVPAEQPCALWQHWGGPSLHWFSGGHLTPFGRARVVDAVAEHVRRLGLIDAAS